MAELGGFALVLGASSGFGAATAKALARDGMDVCGVHLDRRATLPQAEATAAAIRAHGRRALFFNVNAADEEKRKGVLDALEQELGEAKAGAVKVLVHSLAFGTLRPLVGEDGVTKAQLEMTLDVMANSLVYWTGELVRRGLLADGGRVFAMTSSGGTKAIASYGPVGAAKAALESYCRQLALELGPRRIAVNAIRAGVAETPALAKIPGSGEMVRVQKAKNPGGRLTTPEDVAEAVALLARPGAGWISGNTLGVDGGEDIVA
jgi:enoyl-[acyl-carrier protein] reductase III